MAVPALCAAGAEVPDVNNVPLVQAENVAAYRVQAQQGSAKAKWLLAECYRQGLGIAQDETKAFALYQQAADQGYVPAIHALGVCYMLGVGTQPQPERALPLITECAAQGYIKSLQGLSKVYIEGIPGVVEPDYPRALELAMQGVAAGDVACMQGAGVLLLVPQYGFNRVEEALALLHQAAQKGDATSIYQLANVYFYGEFGVQRDLSRGIAWLQRGVELQHADSAYLLGGCYLEGVGVVQDAAKAVPLLELAAEASATPTVRAGALHALALCYYFGHGVEPSLHQATEYAKAAAAAGSKAAAGMLRDLEAGTAPPMQ